MQQQTFESNNRKLVFTPIVPDAFGTLFRESMNSFIKVLWLPAGYELSVDFQRYTTRRDSLFFINSHQHIEPISASGEAGVLLCYNRDFYCIQIHDAEVACDGLLFNNLNGMPLTEIPNPMQPRIRALLRDMEQEFAQTDTVGEEMLRTYLKQLIIHATRMWKDQRLPATLVAAQPELEFFRQFSMLVEKHFREKHSVSEYAPLLNLAAKTLSNKLRRLNLPQPNEVIKDRIMLEAKRLLIYTPMSAKEIAYDLGYDDPAYFNRLFVRKTGNTPTAFRKSYA
ncbi:AraC family transcriptional regulator [Rurimicrobium arvi]|uniref:Helix-turn-helix domain-containing protein n=1 Tax=Rurimicrobium arvi TaxID=2049916 RepID=A0ABP8N1X1_9BACT